MLTADSRYDVIEGQVVDSRSGDQVGPANDPSQWKRIKTKEQVRDNRATQPALQLDQNSLAYEEQTGFKSRRRVALEIAVPIAQTSRSWEELHRRLAEEGIAIGKHGRGAAYVVDGKPVAASIDRSTSAKRLEARLGPMTASSYTVRDSAPRPMWPDDAQRSAYFAAKRSHSEQVKRIAADFRAVVWRPGEPAVVMAMASARRAAEVFPSFAEWQAGARPPSVTEAFHLATGSAGFSVAAPHTLSRTRVSLKGYDAIRLQGRTIYRFKNQEGPPAFVDTGNWIFLPKGDNREAVRTSLLLVAARFPDSSVAVAGDERFKRLVLQLADEEGIRLDGELGKRQAKLVQARALPEPAPTVVNRSPTGPLQRPTRPQQAAPQSPLSSPVAPVRAADPQLSSKNTEGQRLRELQRILASIARHFHSGWDSRDYWPHHDHMRGAPLEAPRDAPRIGARQPVPKSISESLDPAVHMATAHAHAARARGFGI